MKLQFLSLSRQKTGSLADPETEEAEVETEEEVTEEVLIAEKTEEKNEEELDWF